jgi:hypothetical protein
VSAHVSVLTPERLRADHDGGYQMTTTYPCQGVSDSQLPKPNFSARKSKRIYPTQAIVWGLDALTKPCDQGR